MNEVQIALELISSYLRPELYNLGNEFRDMLSSSTAFSPDFTEHFPKLRSWWLVPPPDDRYMFSLQFEMASKGSRMQICHVQAIHVVLEQIGPGNFVSTPDNVSKSFHRISVAPDRQSIWSDARAL